MFKNHVDNFKLDTNINLILQNSRKTIKNVKNYLAEPDELNLDVQDFGKLSSNRADLNFKEFVNKTEVPPVWDENLHKMYIKSLVETYLSPRLSDEENRLMILNAPKVIPSIVRKLSNEPVLKLDTRNHQMNTNKNSDIILHNEHGNKYDLTEQVEDATSQLQWNPIKQNSEERIASNSKSILPDKSDKPKKDEQQKKVSTDIPKAPNTLDQNKKRIAKVNKKKNTNIVPVPNKKLNDNRDHSKMYSNSARSSRISEGKNSKISKIEPTFIRFIGKRTKNPIDFNKEHPGLLVEASEDCKTLFPRRILKSDNTNSNNPEQIEGKINSLSCIDLQENMIDRKNNEKDNFKKDRAKLVSKHNTESKTEDNFGKQITTKSKSKPQIVHSENKPNDEASRTTNKCDEAISKEDFNQSLNKTKILNSERSTLNRDEFARMILDDFIEYQKNKSKTKKRSVKSSKLEIPADPLPSDLQKNQSECIPISPDRAPDPIQNASNVNFINCNLKDTSFLENNSIPKQTDERTWHDVLTIDKNIEPLNPVKTKLPASSNNKISEDKAILKIDKNLEIIYDKSNRFEVKKVSVSNNEKLKKLQIKALPVFCIRGECKVQKTVSIEIKPIEEFLKPFPNDNVQYSQIVHNIKNNEETEANNINLIKRTQPLLNDIAYENQIQKRFHIINQEEINAGNLTFDAKNSLSTIEENDDDNYSSENGKKIINIDSQSRKVQIIPDQQSSSMLISNEQDLSPIDVNAEEEAITRLNTAQYKTNLSSNPILTTSDTSGILNTNLDETLTTQTDEEKLCIKNKSTASDTNLSEEDSSEIDSRINISKKKSSSTSIDFNGKYQENDKINKSKDFLSILENVFLKALKSNNSSAKESKECSTSSSRSLLDSSQYKRKEAIKKKYIDLAKKDHSSENIFKEVSVQTDDVSNQMDFLLNQSSEQNIPENLVENIFEKIRKDVPAGLKEFKSYKRSNIEKFAFTKPDNECDDVIKKVSTVEDKMLSNRVKTPLFNDIQINPVSSSSLISVSSNDNKKNCTFRLNSDLNNRLEIFDERKLESSSEVIFEKQVKSNADTSPEHATYSKGRLSARSKSNVNTGVFQVSKKANSINENLPSNLNLELDDGNSSMFSLGSNGIVVDKINYQCRSSEKGGEISSKGDCRSNRKIQNAKIAKTVEKLLKDGENFKESKRNCSAEVQNAVKYFLDNLNSSNDSVNVVNKNYEKPNNMYQMAPGPSLHTTSHYISLNNPNIKKKFKNDLDLRNILGCSSKHNQTFNISEKSSEISSTDNLIANHSFHTKNYHINKSDLNTNRGSSVSSQGLKNNHLKKNSNFEQFLTKHVPDLSSNIDLNELYYSSTDDFLLSEQEQQKILAEANSKSAEDVLSISDGEILSIGEIKDK